MVVMVDVVGVLVGVCGVGDVVVEVGGDEDRVEDVVEIVVTAGSCAHKSYQVEGVVVVGLDLEVGLSFAWLSALDLRKRCGFHVLLLGFLRASLSAVDKVLMSVAPKFGGGSPRASGVIR